ncbi:MAG: T9SS type A sorting domain-containing protein [Saprospiraceae bacterium]|nr:T9SS type A sorting domain-containing protein [Saprospiraceae bacterium]
MKNLIILSFLFSCFYAGAQDCTMDTEAPTIVCFFGVGSYLQPVTPSADIDGDGILDDFASTIKASDCILEGLGATEDNCSSVLDYRIELMTEEEVGEVPTSSSIVFTESTDATINIRVWAGDEAGNWTYCETWGSIRGGAGCADQAPIPRAYCKAEVEVRLDPSSAVLTAADVNEGSYDPCSDNVDIGISLHTETTSPEEEIVFTSPGTHIVKLTVLNENGYQPSCLSYVNVLDQAGNDLDCEADSIPPIVQCLNTVTYQLSPENPVVEIYGSTLGFRSFDNCGDLEFRIGGPLPAFTPPEASVLRISEVEFFHELIWVWAIDQAGNVSHCRADVRIETDFVKHELTGSVFADNGNCTRDPQEALMGGVEIQAQILVNGIPGPSIIVETTGTEASFYTVDLQEYKNGQIGFSAGETVEVNPTDQVDVELLLWENLNSSCQNSYLVTDIPIGQGASSFTNDFGIAVESNCAALSVDLTAPFLRRCFSSTYWVNYCNYGGAIAGGVTVQIDLDPSLTLLNSPLPWMVTADGKFNFELGTLAGGTCGRFPIHVRVSCESDFGATHCSSAKIYFDNTCQGFGDYDGPELELGAKCLDEQVKFTIRNIGGDMTEGHKYIVIEDILMVQEGTTGVFRNGEGQTLSLPANGSTFRLEVEQADDYPWGKISSIALEGCGENEQGETSQGYVMQFPIGNGRPDQSMDCQENIGSYDPNDKQGFPAGLGDDKLILPNAPLEYMIRFQNTGTDTAFTVRIEDQLSEWLDINTVKPGASSHPYAFSIKENRLMEFRFDNILLPDSTTNLEASNGFVRFNVQQKADNPLGVYINNTADIYFDFNEAVRTNTVTHLIGEITLTHDQEAVNQELLSTLVPNPFREMTVLHLAGEISFPLQLRVYDPIGQLVHEDLIRSNKHQIDRTGLPAGIYLYTLTDRKGKIGTGKLIAN